MINPHRFDLTDKVAWVAGGAGLLGSEVVKALAEHGAHVVIADPNVSEAQRAADELVAAGLIAEALELDVADADAADRPGRTGKPPTRAKRAR